MKIGILTIGNELTSGKTQDTNSSFIARELYRRGWQVAAMLSVGDDPDAIKGGLDFLFSVADGLIITGGLPVLSYVLDRVEEDEIPLLRTGLDTVGAVKAIEALYAATPFPGGEAKLARISELLAGLDAASLFAGE